MIWANDRNRMTYAMVVLLALVGGGFTQASAQGVTYQQVGTAQSSVPDGFMPCANDFQTCSLNALAGAPEVKTLTIFYGVPGKYTVIQGTSPNWTLSSFMCLPGTFGVPDPAPNVKKACWIFAGYPVAGPNDAAVGSPVEQVFNSSVLTSELTKCADDFQTCSTGSESWLLPGTMWTGYYGVGDKFVKISGMGNFECSPSSIGVPDPMMNVRKSCYIRQYVRQMWYLRSTSLDTVPGVSATYKLSLYEGTGWPISFPIRSGQGMNNMPESTEIKLRGTISALPTGYALIIGSSSLLPVSFGFANDVLVSKQNNSGKVTYSIESLPGLTIISDPVLQQP
jgi:hypothetical protein